MNWKEFLPLLLKDFRLSSSEFEHLTGVSNVTVSNIRNGKTIAPTQNTISKIEKALSIKIDDSNTDNITYEKIEAPKDNQIIERTYKVINDIAAGVSEINDMFQIDYTTVTFDPNNHNILQIQSEKYSMAPAVLPGDKIVIDYSAKPKIGDFVVVAWQKNEKRYSALKLYGTNGDTFVSFYSINTAEPPLVISKKELIKIVKVVQVIKQ